MRQFIVIILILFLGFVAPAQPINDLQGVVFRDYKNVSQLEHYEKIADTSFTDLKNYDSFSLLHLKEEKQHLIIMSREFYDDKDGYPSDEILDVIAIPNNNRNELIAVSYCYYKEEDKYSENVFALLQIDPATKKHEIKKAWIGNSSTKKIEAIDSELIKECDYLELGTQKQIKKWKN